MARTLHTDLEPGDVIVIPPGASATIEVVEKSGRRVKVKITADQPVTLARADDAAAKPAPMQQAIPVRRAVRRPTLQT